MVAITKGHKSIFIFYQKHTSMICPQKREWIIMINALTKDSGTLLRKSRTWVSMAATFILVITAHAFAVDFVLATSFDQAFPDKWTHSSPKTPPYLSNRDTVYAGMPWRIHVLFKEYSRDYSGNADLSFSYKILKPNGTMYYDTTEIQGVSGSITNDTGPLLSHRIPIVSFSRKDLPGKYHLIVTAEDKISRAKRTKEKTIILSKYPTTAPSYFTDISFNVWIHSYCLDPDPGRAITAFSYFIGSKMSDNDAIFWPVFYFFQCLFSDNPPLVQKLAGTIPKSTPRLREYTVFLLRTIQIRKSDIEYPIPDSLWIKFDKAAATGFSGPFTDAFRVKSNQLVESAFYYYGKYSMIRLFIDCLGTDTPAGYEAFIKHCKVYGDECPEVLDKETALQFCSDAHKILGKAYLKHPLITAYCNYAFENDHLETNARNALKEIVLSSKK
jgi:hypothetical protein